MSGKTDLKPVAVVLGTVIATALANTPVVNADENPFSMQPLSSGYMVLAEGKGGEGKCGMKHMDADSDDKVTREEFMQSHEAMFDRIDKNGDGVIDADEHKAHRQKMQSHMQEGKSGEGKCGGSK